MHVDIEDYIDYNDLKLREILMILKDISWSADGGTPVDGSIWYAISAKRPVSTWLRESFTELEKRMWFDTGTANSHIERFDVHEKIYTQLLLRWPLNT